jgi:hypothetical protein
MVTQHNNFRGLFSLISLGLFIVVALGCVKEDVTEDCIKKGRRYYSG